MTSSFFSELVGKLIEARSEKLGRLFEGADRYEDAIEYSRASPVAGIRVDSMFSPERHLQNRLGHVSVNPNDPANTAILRDAYVYAKVPDPERIERTINSSRGTAETFLRALIKRAQEFRQLSLMTSDVPDKTGKVLSSERNFLIIGERGSGKTFFINHLFSTFHTLLNEQRIIWIRVNLVPDRGFDADIHNWICAQAAKILLRYYDTISDRNSGMSLSNKKPFYKMTYAWILNNFTGDQLSRYVDALEEMRQAFAVGENDQEISPSLCNPILCRELYRQARLSGLAFIIVLDGLDRLESNAYYTQRFSKISESVRTLWGSYEILGCIFVYVTRGETFDANRNVAPYNRFDPSESFLIQAAGIKDIFEARIDAVISEIVQLQKSKPDVWGVKDWIGILGEFRREILSDSDQNETTSYLDQTFTTNNRAKVQIVQLRFQDHMRSVSRQAYKLIEHMMLAGWRFPPRYYDYKLVDGRLDVRIPDQSHIDNRYLPVITRPPLPTSPHKLKTNWYSADSILLGIRILQVVSEYELWAGRRQPRDIEPITVSEVGDILQGLFNYPREQIVALVWELDNFEIIRPIYNGDGIERTENTYLGTFPKARYILGVCLQDVAYLSLCGMRTPISREGHVLLRCFRAAYLDYGEPKSFERWTIAKIVNASSMAMLLNYANERQRVVYHRRVNDLSLRQELMRFLREVGPFFFEFVDAVVPAVRRELSSIYASATTDRGFLHIDPSRLEAPLKAIAQRLIEQ